MHAGVCFIHNVFSSSEIGTLQSELPQLLARCGDAVVREPDAGSVARIVYGCHVFSEQFRQLSLHPRLLHPVRQLLREENVYIHQTRLNPKQPFSGGTWDWVRNCRLADMPSDSSLTSHAEMWTRVVCLHAYA